MSRTFPIFVAITLCAVALGMPACGPKLDPVQVETDTSDAGDGTTNNAGDSSTSTNPNSTTTTTGLCGTSATTIGYSAQVQAVVSKNCALSSCHGAGAQLPTMTDFASTKSGISGGGLDDVKSARMPLGRTLTANEKCIITSWASGNYAP